MTDSTTRDALLSVIRRELRGLNVRVAKQACSRFIEAGLISDSDFDTLIAKGFLSGRSGKKEKSARMQPCGVDINDNKSNPTGL